MDQLGTARGSDSSEVPSSDTNEEREMVSILGREGSGRLALRQQGERADSCGERSQILVSVGLWKRMKEACDVFQLVSQDADQAGVVVRLCSDGGGRGPSGRQRGHPRV